MEPVPFHIGVVTGDLRASMEQLGAGLGITWTAPLQGPGTVDHVDGGAQPRPLSCISREGPVHVDLIEGAPGTIWETDAPRVHHFAYWSDDLEGDIERLAGHGYRLELTRWSEAGQPSVFAYLIGPEGLRVELIDVAGRDDYYRRLEGGAWIAPPGAPAGSSEEELPSVERDRLA
jgi:hypothetical protein